MLICALVFSCFDTLNSKAASDDNIEKLVSLTSDCVGYQYLYVMKNNKTKTVKLSAQQMFDIAGMTMSSPTKYKLKNKTYDLFGKKPSTKYFKKYDSEDIFQSSDGFSGQLSSGKILTMVGDWGTVVPRLYIKKIERVKNGVYKVTAQTDLENYENDTSEKIGTTTFIVKSIKKAKYDYVITGIKLKCQNENN